MTRLNVIFVSALLHQDGLDLPQLLERSSPPNPSNALHCMTLFAAGSLMQVIDGEVDEARAELQRVFQSPLYRDSIVLNEEEVPAPSLSCSSLGALHLAPGVRELLPEGLAYFSLNASAVAQRVRSSIAHNLLKQFAADYS